MRGEGKILEAEWWWGNDGGGGMVVVVEWLGWNGSGGAKVLQ